MPYKNKEQAVLCSQRYYQNNKEKVKAYQKEYRVKNKKIGIDSTAEYFWHKYGITLDDYDEMLYKQGFKCGICERHVTELSQPLFVDHDHTTGNIRGLLCNRCNSAIGALGDNVSGLLKALQYLENEK